MNELSKILYWIGGILFVGSIGWYLLKEIYIIKKMKKCNKSIKEENIRLKRFLDILRNNHK